MESRAYSKILVERNIAIPMRDEIILRADIYRPETSDALPAIIARLPYNKDALLLQSIEIEAIRAAEVGYAIVYQDTRGRYQSGGQFYPYTNEGDDGFDTIEWVASQSWCSGSVGMTGGSYIGATQWLAAAKNPPHLKAIFPFVTGSDFYEGWTYKGGAFQLGFTLFWTLRDLAPEEARRLESKGKVPKGTSEKLMRASDAMLEYDHLPLLELPILKETNSGNFYYDWLQNSSNTDYWKKISIREQYKNITVPAYNVGAWHDIFLSGTLENYLGMKQLGATDLAKRGQRLLIGPWAHGAYSGTFPEYNYGIHSSAGTIDLTTLQLHFFDHYLKGIDNGLCNEPPVRLFVMGKNEWRSENEWPLARTKYEKWFIHSSGNSGLETGILSRELPSDEPYDTYVYDPKNPVPTIGGPTLLQGVEIGANSGPRDQRRIEERKDVLCYTSQILQEPLEVTGPLKALIFASSSAVDTDFVVKLCDVFPDGASRLLAEGILRARFRGGYEKEVFLIPDEIASFPVNLVATSNVFMPGHRIRIDITSSSYPRFDCNANSGKRIGTDKNEDRITARQKIFHDNNYPSHILLPVITN